MLRKSERDVKFGSGDYRMMHILKNKFCGKCEWVKGIRINVKIEMCSLKVERFKMIMKRKVIECQHKFYILRLVLGYNLEKVTSNH